MNTICKEVKIIPTNEVGSGGYKEAVIYAGEEGTIIDAFEIKGNVRIDFEAENGIRIWAAEGELHVYGGYGVTIEAIKQNS